MYSCVPEKPEDSEDLRGPVRIGVLLDDLVERPLHVEHHRLQAAAVRTAHVRNRPGDVVQ
jgi:hypothetical protein